jgi:hypothetical protein
VSPQRLVTDGDGAIRPNQSDPRRPNEDDTAGRFRTQEFPQWLNRSTVPSMILTVRTRLASRPSDAAQVLVLLRAASLLDTLFTSTGAVCRLWSRGRRSGWYRNCPGQASTHDRSTVAQARGSPKSLLANGYAAC